MKFRPNCTEKSYGRTLIWKSRGTYWKSWSRNSYKGSILPKIASNLSGFATKRLLRNEKLEHPFHFHESGPFSKERTEPFIRHNNPKKNIQEKHEWWTTMSDARGTSPIIWTRKKRTKQYINLEKKRARLIARIAAIMKARKGDGSAKKLYANFVLTEERNITVPRTWGEGWPDWCGVSFEGEMIEKYRREDKKKALREERKKEKAPARYVSEERNAAGCRNNRTKKIIKREMLPDSKLSCQIRGVGGVA